MHMTYDAQQSLLVIQGASGKHSKEMVSNSVQHFPD